MILVNYHVHIVDNKHKKVFDYNNDFDHENGHEDANEQDNYHDNDPDIGRLNNF